MRKFRLLPSVAVSDNLPSLAQPDYSYRVIDDYSRGRLWTSVSGIHRSLQSYELGITASVASWDIAKRPSLCRQLSWLELITRDDKIASLLRKLDYFVPRR